MLHQYSADVGVTSTARHIVTNTQKTMMVLSVTTGTTTEQAMFTVLSISHYVASTCKSSDKN